MEEQIIALGNAFLFCAFFITLLLQEGITLHWYIIWESSEIIGGGGGGGGVAGLKQGGR